MKKYAVVYATAALRSLRKMDPPVAAMLYGWIEKNLSGCADPRQHGKALAGNLAKLWRYRVGDYRMIAEIDDDKVVILMLEIGHRSQIYR